MLHPSGLTLVQVGMCDAVEKSQLTTSTTKDQDEVSWSFYLSKQCVAVNLYVLILVYQLVLWSLHTQPSIRKWGHASLHPCACMRGDGVLAMPGRQFCAASNRIAHEWRKINSCDRSYKVLYHSHVPHCGQSALGLRPWPRVGDVH